MKLKTENLEIGTFIIEQLEDILPIFPIVSENGVSYPFALYRRTGMTSKNSKDIYNHEEHISIEIIVASSSYKESIKFAGLIKEKLEGLRGTWRNTWINNIVMDNSNEDWSNDAYIQKLYFTINLDNGKMKR